GGPVVRNAPLAFPLHPCVWDLQSDPSPAARRGALSSLPVAPRLLGLPALTRAVRPDPPSDPRRFRYDGLHRGARDGGTRRPVPGHPEHAHLSGRLPGPAEQTKGPDRAIRALLCKTPATTYSPGPLPAQYHRPWRA